MSQAQLEANKRLVLDFWRLVIEARNGDAAADFLAEDLVQHNPLMGDGLAGFLERARVLWRGEPPRPPEPTLREPPILVLAEGDLVQLVHRRTLPDPADPMQVYDRFTFDLYRIERGKIVEHWDAVAKPGV